MKYGLTLLLCLIISGCSFHQEAHRQSKELADTAKGLLEQPFLRQQMRASKAKKILLTPGHEWLDNRFTGSYQNIPASLAITSIAGEFSVVFSPGIKSIHTDNQPRVSASGMAMTLREHLDHIARQANWTYEVMPKRTIKFSDRETRVFKLAVPHSIRSARLGREADEEGQNAAHQFSSSPWEELERGLRSVLDNHPYALMPSAGTIAITAPPDLIERAGRLIESFNRSVAQRVLIQLELFLVDLADSKQDSLDWSFIRQAGSGQTLTLESEGVDQFTGNVPFSLQLSNLTDGRYRGSELIFKALSQQGSTSVLSRPRLICLNNQVSELRLNRVTPYTRSLTITERNSGNTTSLSPEVESDEVAGGMTIYLLPSILDDRINITLSANYTQVTRFIVQDIGSGAAGSVSIRLPEYDDTQFTLPVSLRSGETMVLAGNPRTVISSDGRHNPLLPLFASRNSSKRRYETVMLLTAHILDPS